MEAKADSSLLTGSLEIQPLRRTAYIIVPTECHSEDVHVVCARVTQRDGQRETLCNS